MDRAALDAATPDELTEAVGQLHAAECAMRRAFLEVVAAVDRTEAWKVDGATSPAAWLAALLNVDHATAGGWVRVARDLEALPAIAAAFGEGRLSWDQVEAATRFASAETDGAVAADAPGCSVAALRRSARRHRPPPAPDAPPAVRWWWGSDGTLLHLHGRLRGGDGAVVVRALERVAGLAEPHPETGLFEPYSRRCADALVEVASARLAADPDHDLATVVVHVDAADLVAERGSAEVADGPTVGIAVARRLACDARLEVVAEGVNGGTLGVGRVTRRIPPWLRRRVERRDGGCRFPGCGRTRWVQVHHIVHWADGGLTDLDNLVTLCGFHHRLVHERGWRVVGHPGRTLRFLRPDGRPLALLPPTLRDDVRNRLVAPLVDGCHDPPVT
jgi:hypothetical protein